METLVAALLPALVAIAAARQWASRDLRLAIERLFVPATLVWFSPCWLLGKSPVAFDYLAARIPPWSATVPKGFASGNALLSDVPLQFIPWREVVTAAWRAGSLPFLNPFAGSGSPLWENPQAAVLSPFTIAGLLFTSFAWPLFAAVAKTLVALAGTYLFLRAEGSSDAGARFGAIAYGFGAFSIAFLLFPHTNVTAFLPLFLFALNRTVSAGDSRAAAGAAIVLFFLFAGGHPETLLHVALLAIPYAAWKIAASARPHRLRSAANVGLAGIAGVSLAAPLLLPLLFYLPSMERYSRIHSETRLGAAPPLTVETAASFVAPGALENERDEFAGALNFNESGTGYVGLATFALAIAVAIANFRQNRFWLAALACFVLLAFDLPLISRLIAAVPIVGGGMHGRVRFLIAMLLAVLGAQAFDRLGDRFRLIVRALLSIAAVAAAVLVVTVPASTATAAIQRNAVAIVVTGILAVLVGRADSGVIARFAPVLIFLDLFSILGTYNPATGREFFYPSTGAVKALAAGGGPFRIVGIEDSFLPNSSAIYGIEDLRVHDPSAYEPYVAFLERAGFDRRYYFNRFHAIPPRVLLDYLGVRRLILPPGSTAEEFREVYRGADGVVLDNPYALRRFFVPTYVQRTGDPFAAFRQERDARRVYLGPGAPVELNPAKVSVEEASINRRRVRVSAPRPTFVASSEVALPGWKLMRNGKRWPLERVNGEFVGWVVPAGGGTFELGYQPRGFALGVAIAGLGVAILLWITLGSPRKRAQEPE